MVDSCLRKVIIQKHLSQIMLKKNIEAIYILSTCVGVRQGVRVEACTCFKTIIGATNYAWFGLQRSPSLSQISTPVHSK